MGKKVEVEDHLGNKFESITSMCNHYGIGVRLYLDRINRGFTVKQALGVEEKKRKGYSIDELLSLYNLSYEQWSFGNDIGLTIQQTRDLVDGKLYLDHEQNVYKSFNKMCKAWNKNASTVRNRMKKGYSLEEALEK